MYKIINELSHLTSIYPSTITKKEYWNCYLAIYQMPDQDYASPGPIYNTWGLGMK